MANDQPAAQQHLEARASALSRALGLLQTRAARQLAPTAALGGCLLPGSALSLAALLAHELMCWCSLCLEVRMLSCGCDCVRGEGHICCMSCWLSNPSVLSSFWCSQHSTRAIPAHSPINHDMIVAAIHIRPFPPPPSPPHAVPHIPCIIRPGAVLHAAADEAAGLLVMRSNCQGRNTSSGCRVRWQMPAAAWRVRRGALQLQHAHQGPRTPLLPGCQVMP